MTGFNKNTFYIIIISVILFNTICSVRVQRDLKLESLLTFLANIESF